MKKIAWTCSLVILFIGCEAIFVEDISNRNVQILAPTENAVLSTGDITFRWQLLEDADSYQLQVAKPNFNNATQIMLDSVTDTNIITQELAVGAYEWRVKAINSDYETEYTKVFFTVN